MIWRVEGRGKMFGSYFGGFYKIILYISVFVYVLRIWCVFQSDVFLRLRIRVIMSYYCWWEYILFIKCDKDGKDIEKIISRVKVIAELK